ncbi:MULTISPECIES: 23S rRNA (uracil(747)-C(5))-methyltransferase RlmC [unclassified Curtobacterium]|uniref:23S rRNA (uracil(747)-C(5))-methyltransferase RlmC n=1 Tax=unclassified Curtobacterium TaxID=257496 RepID=UPI000F4A313F|nr:MULTISPECIES: 23S rRNA (uracil(747)-C(5))-methyltransferase RlmC [unclassified Curtobacterium]ROQ16793.1 23S rRNA m(5)U-747 methyltransferase [Curtobacterium sp. PhB171]ROQ25130.1 23S rRNA m(5)U-747 methyltransferase [Curtobacterium sp. PhB170]ROS36581.1 23S rRNA m(5)U-747 methyltransferase [Curtobacterium sp. PhB131]ROS71259.1 23S rRNA m(5)U-747 methyltransferase [Curtobacterium sp. PhB141]
MQCDYFDRGVCRSCTLMGQPYADQVLDKELRTRELLHDAVEAAGGPGAVTWSPAITSPESGYRNKAKMVVGGSTEHPTVGILDHRQRGVDLRHCGICTPGIRHALPLLADFVQTAGLIPYDVAARRGELKYVLVTESPDGELMVRFVLRSEGQVARIRQYLDVLRDALPNVVVVTANLLPEHKAVTEGDREIVLTEQETLPMRLGGITMHLRPQSFFQTNTVVATELYAQASAWIDELDPASMWDLYCGVGGFALHAARPGRAVTGIETSAEAIRSAKQSAREAGLEGLRFAADDATEHALRARPDTVPELVLVNPPRRGIGEALSTWLEESDVQHVVYSSCNPVTLAKDLARMPSFRLRRARVLDMFPQTGHLEAVTLLSRA